MDRENRLSLLEDRIIEIDLKNVRTNVLRQGYGWYVDGDNHDYLSNELVKVSLEEVRAYGQASEDCIHKLDRCIDHVLEKDLLYQLGISKEMEQIITYDWKRNVPLICGRFDFSGGIEGVPLKLLEYNADTCTILPETVLFQKWMKDETPHKKQWNSILEDITHQFEKLAKQFPDFHKNLLLTSLGHEDDELNLKVYKQAGEQAGFNVEIAPLEQVIFADEGVFLEKEGEYENFPFVHKLVPWEFIMKEEPELLEILSSLILQDLVVVTNPSYGLMYQSKAILATLYKLFPEEHYVLPTYLKVNDLMGASYVKKSVFGRMGENIEVYDRKGSLIHKTSGHSGSGAKVYQQYAEMLTDDEEDIYQPGIFMCGKKSTGLSFRRNENGIVDDDSEFLGHLIVD